MCSSLDKVENTSLSIPTRVCRVQGHCCHIVAILMTSRSFDRNVSLVWLRPGQTMVQSAMGPSLATISVNFRLLLHATFHLFNTLFGLTLRRISLIHDARLPLMSSFDRLWMGTWWIFGQIRSAERLMVSPQLQSTRAMVRQLQFQSVILI